MSTSATNTVTFTGTSRYSADFQNLINRSLAIASLPITQLNLDLSTLSGEGTALNTLNQKVSDLSDAVKGLNTAMGSGSFNATVQDPSIVDATVSDGAMEGNYSIEVDSLGAYTTTSSKATGNLTVTDPSTTSISSASNYTLTVGGNSFSIIPASHSLYALADAINSSSAGVQASITNQGSTSAPDYRLTLKNSLFGNANISLAANTTSSSGAIVSTPLMDPAVVGNLATYKPNGSSTQQTSNSPIVTLSPGLNVTMKALSTPGQSTSITLTRQSETIAGALQTFATAYQAAQDAIHDQRGAVGGALAGQPIVFELQDVLNQISGFNQPGSTVKSLSDLGVTFDKTTFKMTFDASTFYGASLGHMDGISAFLGDGTTSGFLKAANAAISNAEDPTRGTLQNAITDNQTQVANDNARIATETAAVDKLQYNLMTRMNAADALISSMEQQYSVITSLFTAMNSSSSSTASTTTNSLA